MFTADATIMPVATLAWQDYRGSDTGIVLFYESDPACETPIREVPESLPSDVPPDPHYETGTYGMYSSSKPKVRAAFVKSKMKYLFFMTKYQGTRPEFQNQMIVCGYYEISHVADAKRFHIRYCNDYEAALDVDNDSALRAKKTHFVTLDNAVVLTPELLVKWGITTKLTRQSRLTLHEEATVELLDLLNESENVVDTYISETKRLSPAVSDEEEEDDDGDGE